MWFSVINISALDGISHASSRLRRLQYFWSWVPVALLVATLHGVVTPAVTSQLMLEYIYLSGDKLLISSLQMTIIYQ